MERHIYLVQPTYRDKVGALLKGRRLGLHSAVLPALSAAVPGHWRKTSCIEYFDDICAGDTLTSQSYLADVVESPSASLGLLLISTNKTEYTNQNGKVVAVTTGTSIRY